MVLEEDIPLYADYIKDAWNECSKEDIREGENWYPSAHKLALQVGDGDAKMGAGLIAALSPQKSWSINQRLALSASEGNLQGQVSDALNKARRILEGQDPYFVLPMTKKTGHFYMNIFEPFNPHYVTVDRHAYRIATREFDNGSPRFTEKQYGYLARAYIQAAYDIGVIPNVLQAATWVWVKR